jgi:hypothetical protein
MNWEMRKCWSELQFVYWHNIIKPTIAQSFPNQDKGNVSENMAMKVGRRTDKGNVFIEIDMAVKSDTE